MKIQTSYFGEYFKKSVSHLSKSKIVFLIISLIEFMEVLVCLLEYQDFFFLLNQNYSDSQTQLAKILLSIIPYSYYFEYFVKESPGFDAVYIAISIYLFFVICFFVYLIFGTKKSNEEIQLKNILNNIIDKICVNFFDLILFRLTPFYGINAIIRGIFKIIKLGNYSVGYIILEFLLVLFLVFVVFLHYHYFLNVCIWNNFKVINSSFSKYPYEIFYSKKYDIVMFTLKLLITLAKNYLNYNNNIANFIVLFFALLLEIIFFGFAFYTFYLLFFSNDVLYFYLNFYNKLRIFLLVLMVEALVIRFGLHTNGDYIPYLAFMIMLLIFNFFFIFLLLDSYILTSAISSQNYVGVCWFIQGNDANIQNFTIEWISNHREQCVLNAEQCPICSKISFKLKSGFNIYSEENLNLLTNENNIANINKINNSKKKNHNKSIVKKRTIIKKSIIDEMFPPFRFFFDLIKLAEKSKKFMSKDDLIRLDILYITALFYNEKNIDYYFYTKLCLFLIKYNENSQVLMTLMLIFDIMHNESISLNQKYQLLKKNEELRCSLEEYLKEYNDFFLYSNKSPINYFMISKKYKNFKNLLKPIYVYFKKNLECSYDLIVMRYIYETLVHQKMKNMQPFDLNNYADFIEYHYTNNKSFSIKNIIDQDIFIILKGSKEILKYQNKPFESLFPSEFQHDAINQFKTKLCDFNQKVNNPIFEYTINSFTNSLSQKFDFVDSFKMRYNIYPTHLINELYIQANYIVGYNNIIILEKNSSGFDILFSFSPKLYKIFGLYPSDINLLKEAGIEIYFNDIFKQCKNKNNDGKHIFIFDYEKYSLLLNYLLTFDILKDSPNYKQILDKKNTFEIIGDTRKKIQFQMTIKWEYKNDTNKLYKFLTIKETRKKKVEKSLAKNTSHFSKKSFSGLNTDNEEDSNSDEDDFEYLNDDVFGGKGMGMAASILSSVSAKSFESAESGKQKGKKNEKSDEKKKKKEQLHRYTYILLCFSIILIILTVIFLVLETNENNHFRKVSNLFIVFRQFKRGIERIPLTLLSNLNVLYKENTSENAYDQYSKNLGKKSEMLKNYKLNKLLIDEISGKIDSVVDSFNNYQKEITTLGSSLSKRINALKGKTYRLFFNEKVTVLTISVTYISFYRQYLNIISSLLKNNAYLEAEFPLSNFMDFGDVNTEVDTVPFNTKENTIVVKNIMTLAFSYPYSHSGLVDIADIILNESRKIISHITKILIIFFIVLFVLHIVLSSIAILFIYSFTNILKLNIIDSNKLFGDKKFLEFHQRRLEQIKIIKNLYSENPLKIADKIDAIEEFYKREKSEENKGANRKKSLPNVASIVTLSEKKQEEKNESGKEDKNEILKKNTNQHNIDFESKEESFIVNNENHDKNNKITDLKDIEFNEIQIENGISSKNIKLTQKQFLPILRLEYFLVYITFGFYFIYSVVFIIIIYFNGIVLLKNLLNYSNYNDLVDGYVYDISNALLFMFQTNCTAINYGYITNPDRKNNYIEEGIDLLHKAIIGKDDVEFYKEGFFPPLSTLINSNCSAGIIKDDDFIKIAEKNNFDYNKYFGELCELFPVVHCNSDTRLFHEVLYLIDLLYRNYTTHKTFEDMFKGHLNKTSLYDLYTLILTFNRMQRNYFNDYIFSGEVISVSNYFARLMYIYLIISVVFELIIFLVVYLGIIKHVNSKDNLIMNFLDSLKYE